MKRQLELKEIKERNLNTLVYFKNFCNAHQLRYYLAFGTLLGAVRHRGFIPWDDDIDVLMPRKDYNKLLSLTDEINNSQWELLSFRNNSNYLFPYMKLCDRQTEVLPSRFSSGLIYGLSIDIFPLDYNPGKNEKEARQICCESRDYLSKKIRRSCVSSPRGHNGKNDIKRLVKKVIYHVGNKRDGLLAEYRKIEDQFQFVEKNEFVFYFNSSYRALWKDSSFHTSDDDCSELTFEGEKFLAPYDYHAVLTETYGDYMQLPPIEKRVSRHTYDAYLKDH
ncbi:MAG: LicD family protein [Oscillospiraceae bacterium]|nr:LicD family protein [Oscillospiraceae bacterium]